MQHHPPLSHGLLKSHSTTPRAFISAVEPSLSATREWQNCLPIGIYNQYLSDTPPQPRPGGSPDAGFTLLSTHDPSSSQICLVATKSPSYHCLGVFSAVPILSLDITAHIDAIVANLDVNDLPFAFNGNAQLVDAISSAVTKLRGPDTKIITEVEVIGAVITRDTLSSTSLAPETLEPSHEIRRCSYPADEHCHDTLTVMYRDMFSEARGIDVPYDYSSKTVRDTVMSGDTWGYFIDGVPVASCYCGRPTRNGKSINVVYTNKEFRKKGYAERLVEEVCGRLLGDLKYITLFFLEGSSAGRLYRRIGFGGSEEREFLHKDVRLE